MNETNQINHLLAVNKWEHNGIHFVEWRADASQFNLDSCGYLLMVLTFPLFDCFFHRHGVPHSEEASGRRAWPRRLGCVFLIFNSINLLERTRAQNTDTVGRLFWSDFSSWLRSCSLQKVLAKGPLVNCCHNNNFSVLYGNKNNTTQN